MAVAPRNTGWNEGRTRNLPGMNRDNAPSKPVDQGFVQRISRGIGEWLGMNSGNGSPEMPFFPPGAPLGPMAQGAAGRRFDYPTNVNATTRPRSYEPVDFETLRAIADPSIGGWDLIRLAIETRKDQMKKLKFSILPRKEANAPLRAKSDSRCQQVEEFLRRPDGQHSWDDWCGMLLEEHLVIDAATIFKRPTLDGSVARLEILDGALIKPVLSYDGRRPDSGPAYTQTLKGLPAVHYTPDEIIYAPRNPRVHKMYGYSCVEQILVTVNIGLRRQLGQLAFFTDGSVPDAVAQVPPEWGMERIQEFQDYWDTMVNDAVKRRKLKFIPGGVQFQPTRNDQALVDQFDEWLARIVQYCFSLPPTPLVRMMNRATAENAYEQSQDEGLQPLMTWLKGIVDDIITRWFGFSDLEMIWDDIRKTDPAEKEERDIALANEGGISLDDIRADRGLEPLGVPPFVKGVGPLGFMSVTSIIKAINAGWDLTGLPQAGLGGPAGGELGPGVDPASLGTGGDDDPLNGLPPEILEALGVDPGAAGAPGGGQLQREKLAGNSAPAGNVGAANAPIAPRDPSDLGGKLALNTARGGGNVVAIHKHPGVQAALAQGEAHAKKLAARMAAGGHR